LFLSIHGWAVNICILTPTYTHTTAGKITILY
jgi:hypothetical protein